MTGTLYGVGLGPGDPELITIKAARIIGAADVVAYHSARHGRSIARGVAGRYLRGDQIEEPLIYPLTVETTDHPGGYAGAIAEFYAASAAKLAVHLDAGRDVVLLCEGDPLFYGSYLHMHKRLAGRYRTEVVPGVTSISAAAAAVSRPLVEGEEILTVLPGTLPPEVLTRRLAGTDAAAVLKLGRTFENVRKALEDAGRLDEALYVERATWPTARTAPLSEVDPNTVPYFSLALLPSTRPPTTTPPDNPAEGRTRPGDPTDRRPNPGDSTSRQPSLDDPTDHRPGPGNPTNLADPADHRPRPDDPTNPDDPTDRRPDLDDPTNPDDLAKHRLGPGNPTNPPPALSGGGLLASLPAGGVVKIDSGVVVDGVGGWGQVGVAGGGGVDREGGVVVVGLGPGGRGWLTAEALEVLGWADELVGYGPYLARVAVNPRQGRHVSDNRVEAERAELALELAAAGRRVAVVSSGDPGVFAMASAVLEAAADPRFRGVPVRVVPGVTAAQAVASRVGAPLGHDFCTISLSDRLKPWRVIAERLVAAARADFVIAIYNPASRSRRHQLDEAKRLLLEHRAPGTPVVVGRDVGGPEETVDIVALGELDTSTVDMRCLLIVGSSRTRIVERADGSRAVFTPRRYPDP